MTGAMRSDGSAVFLGYDQGLLIPFTIQPTTLTDNTTYFAMRNEGNNVIWVLELIIQTIYSGIPGASVAPSFYKFGRFRGATPSGGTNVTPAASRTLQYAHGLTYVQTSNGGLTTTGVTFDSHAATAVVHNQASIGKVGFSKPESSDGFQILPGDGICCRADGAIVSGAGLTGLFIVGEKRY